MDDPVQHLGARLAPLLQRHGVLRAIVFGSMARGEPSPRSDLDLIVVKDTAQRFLDRYEPLLREVVAAVPERAVDLLIYTPAEVEAMADRPFLRRALREGKVIYESE